MNDRPSTKEESSHTGNHIVVTGGVGFLGSYLCRALLERGDRVTAIDNLSTGRRARVENLTAHPHFALRIADVTTPGAFADLATITHVAHLACPGSPKATVRRPIDTLRAASTGTLAALDLAASRGARIVVASGPDSNGDPRNTGLAGDCHVHALCARIAEVIARHYGGADVGIVRPFEVYGPHQWPGDGRIAATICSAALRDQTLQVIDSDVRSFVYIADTVDALVAMLDSTTTGPVDIGGPAAVTTAEFAHTATALAGSGWVEVAPADLIVPTAHSPNLDRTHAVLGWRPSTPLDNGLRHTLDWMRTILPPYPPWDRG
ncbi:NAD-dependent epimerase/dehydratase family protein [Nocardia sp. CA-135953]|uniref:NAD-dependent epimerase/dehydratase family protein n=1 Tax=Nocardia sp. CA-135953 TaxID=3239978 RepID=UPI003D95F9CB